MNFQGLGKIEEYQFYLDKAIQRASKKARAMQTKNTTEDKFSKTKRIELVRVNIMSDIITDDLKDIYEKYPMVSALNPFYFELVKVTLDYGQLKKSLGAIKWAKKKISDFNRFFAAKIMKSSDMQQAHDHKKSFIGRISSILRQVKKDFLFLEDARMTMKNLPTVKTKLKTIAIAGFPNVGKTTLLNALTTSKAEIKNYAFTTKGINVGYAEEKNRRIQFIDTPGTLNRFSKMNVPEKIAYLALKHLADAVIYVFDLTESSYPLKEQAALYREVIKLEKPIVVYLAKLDVLEDDRLVDPFVKKYEVIAMADIMQRVSEFEKLIVDEDDYPE